MWKFYTINKVLPTSKQVQLVDPKEFVLVALDTDSKTFVVHAAIREQKEMPMHFKKQAQVGALLFDEALTVVPAEYSDYNNIFSIENIAELPKNTMINDHAIKLEADQQLPFRLI